jgi:hypothetical protein
MCRQSTLRRLVCAVLLPCYLAACTSWKTQKVSPEQVLADEQPDNVRVTLIDGSQVEVFQPTVSGDTLTGLREGQRVSIPLASVSELELREGDSGKTVLLAAGIVIGVGAALVLGALIYCESQGGCWEN